jgi:hypothetical protein
MLSAAQPNTGREPWPCRAPARGFPTTGPARYFGLGMKPCLIPTAQRLRRVSVPSSPAPCSLLCPVWCFSRPLRLSEVFGVGRLARCQKAALP